ncbi:MAG: NAD(P)/FAD-dependent oxidoreductase [Verrucomicrobiales bacterium]
MPNTKRQLDHDVIIMGAGPAGTSTAIRLAALGFNVGIIEHLQFPRAHVGICLSDPTLALLDYIAPHSDLTGAHYWPRRVTAVKWGTPEPNFVKQSGIHVDRGALDQALLRKACVDGVSAYQPASIIDTCSMDEGGWRIAIAVAEKRRELRSSFLVDATGRSAVLPDNRLKDGPLLIALHANWELAKPLDFDGLIEAGEDAWLWYAQTGCRRAAVSVFCAPQSIRTRNEEDIQAHYLHILRQFRMVASCNFARQCSPPRACDATSRHSTNPVSDFHIRVGDACVSVDPLSSQGVHLALLSGIQAAVIINTILKKPENIEFSKKFYSRRIAERVALYNNRTKAEYARVSAVCPEPFWHERAYGRTDAVTRVMAANTEPAAVTAGALVRIAPEVEFTKEPVIDGSFVEEQMCVRHPGIEGAVAFLEGVRLITLLTALPAHMTYDEITTHWRDIVPPSQSDKIRAWLWRNRILVNVDDFK